LCEQQENIWPCIFYEFFRENGEKKEKRQRQNSKAAMGDAVAKRKQFKCPSVATLNAFNLTPDTRHRGRQPGGVGGVLRGSCHSCESWVCVCVCVRTDAAMRVDRQRRFCRHFKNL